MTPNPPFSASDERPAGRVERFETVAALQEEAVASFAAAAIAAIRDRGRFMVALSGGSTPRDVYARLASGTAPGSQIAWERVQFFWGDERHVPPDHPDSNFRMAYDAMLSRLGIDGDAIWRIKGEYPDASIAADEYEHDLRRAFGVHGHAWSGAVAPADGTLPRFDLVLLGMGPDGHCASIFPGTQAVREERRLVVANWVPQFNTSRITLTAPVLNNADAVIFLVQGDDKADALASVLEGPSDPDRFPSQLIRPRHGNVRWLVEAAAARQLTRQ